MIRNIIVISYNTKKIPKIFLLKNRVSYKIKKTLTIYL